MASRLVVTITVDPEGSRKCKGEPNFRAHRNERVRFVFPEQDNAFITFRNGTPFATDRFAVGRTTVEMGVEPNAAIRLYEYEVTWTDAVGTGQGNGSGEIT
jgi:hypothetical protein